MAAPWYETIRQPAFATGGAGDSAFLPNPTRRYDQRLFVAGGAQDATAQQADALEQPQAPQAAPEDDRADWFGLGKRGAPNDRPDFYGLSSSGRAR